MNSQHLEVFEVFSRTFLSNNPQLSVRWAFPVGGAGLCQISVRSSTTAVGAGVGVRPRVGCLYWNWSTVLM